MARLSSALTSHSFIAIPSLGKSLLEVCIGLFETNLVSCDIFMFQLGCDSPSSRTIEFHCVESSMILEKLCEMLA